MWSFFYRDRSHEHRETWTWTQGKTSQNSKQYYSLHAKGLTYKKESSLILTINFKIWLTSHISQNHQLQELTQLISVEIISSKHLHVYLRVVEFMSSKNSSKSMSPLSSSSISFFSWSTSASEGLSLKQDANATGRLVFRCLPGGLLLEGYHLVVSCKNQNL